MSDGVKIIRTIEELNAFLNEKGVMEVALRNQNKRFKEFQKVAINLQEVQNNELAQKAIQALQNNAKMNEQAMKMMGSVAKMQNIGLLLNGLNLCATCAGFAIMYEKLDKMSAEMNQKFNELQKTVKQDREIENDFRFKEVLGSHTEMLDSQRRKKPYSEEEMRELVDQEYNVLSLLINTLQKGVFDDHRNLIFSIFSMLEMFTVSLRDFDKLYYYNNHEVLGDENPWHMSHERWMGAYKTMTSPWFVEKLQDCGIFEMNLSTQEVDAYYLSLLDQVADLKDEIEINMDLLTSLGDEKTYRTYMELSEKEVAEQIKEAFVEAGAGMDANLVQEAYEQVMQQVGVA